MRNKLHLNVGTIGHIDHGKTTLTAAILAVRPNPPAGRLGNPVRNHGWSQAGSEDVRHTATRRMVDGGSVRLRIIGQVCCKQRRMDILPGSSRFPATAHFALDQ